MKVEIRPFGDGDLAEVLELLSTTLGWVPDDHHAAFFAWKHQNSPFGRSPAWVATADGSVVGFRTFLRWEFERSGEVVRSVRAVDTATHPAHRGTGVFSSLTRHGLEALRTEGIAFVFNTPNERSRPGYLKLGWRDVGRLPVLVHPRSVRAMARMARARTAADLWSVPTSAGAPAREALADTAAVERLLASQPPWPGLRTRQSPEFLSWRYAGFPALQYRGQLGGHSVEDGVALFRLRRRGAGVEATIVDVIVPDADERAAASLARSVVRETGADYGVCTAGLRPGRSGFLPLPRRGPIVTWRGVTETEAPGLRSWQLPLGVVELL